MKQQLLLLFLLITIQSFSQTKNQSIGFKENKGQIIDQKGKSNTAVKYLLNTNGLNVQLRKSGFSYDVYEVKKTEIKDPRNPREESSHFHNNQKEKEPDFKLEYTFHRIDIDFVNSNSKVELVAEQKSKDFDNYYNVANKPEGITNVHQYKNVTYKNIYPNIDVVFTIPDDPKKTVEYNFVIHPQGKISDIQLKFNGAETDLVDNKIQMNVRFGKMEETLPASWIEDRGSKKEIEVGYIKIKKDVYGFYSPNNVSDKTMIIDPVPTRLWGTFYGGEDWTESNTIDKDDLGNIYFAGKTASTTTIATLGSHQSSAGFVKYPGLITWDGYIAKFDANGNRIWATYYGGDRDDDIKSVKVSNNKDLIFCGNSNSSNNISTVGSFKENKSGFYSEMFLGKLNSNGIRQWATYYGNDNGMTFANTVTSDNQNYIYLSGTTTSDDFISTPNSFKETRIDNNSFDGFLAKFDANGNRIWGTYFGGEKDDSFEDSSIDKDGNIILVGYTLSETDIASPNSYQPNYHLENLSSAGDGMIVKFSPNGQRIWSTYFGDINSDWIYNGKIYGDNLYITGQTENNNISTPNVFESTMKVTVRSTYFAKFSLTQQKLIWLSYSQGAVTSIYPKNDNEIFITGQSTYGFDIACSNSYNPVNSTFSGFIIKLDENCQKLWGTYFGKTSLIRDPIILSEGTNNFFVTGNDFNSSPDNNITSPGAYIEIPNDSPQGFLMKFQDSEPSSNPVITSNSPICIGNTLELKASGGTNYLWTGPNGFTSTEQNPTIANVTIANSGEYNCLITGTGSCDDTKKITVVIVNTAPPTGNVSQSFCSAQNPTIANIVVTGQNIKWYDAISNGNLLPETTNLVNGRTYYASQTENNCESPIFGITVSVVNTPSAPTANRNQSFCKNENATLNNIQIVGQNIKWYDSNVATISLATTTLLENNKTYYASQTIGCESDRIAVSIQINDTALPTANTIQQFCIDENATITDLNITGTELKWYDSATNGNILNSTDLLQNNTYYASQTLNNCESQRLALSVKIQDTQNPITDSPQVFCIQKNASISNIKIDGQNIKWYDAQTEGINLSESTLLENGITYYASQTNSNCESERTPITIQIQEARSADCINFTEELPYPKFFTPNGDGYNDTWTIDFAYLKPNTEIRIFDRFGKLIKVLRIDSSWDGTLNGYPLPSSDYWFVVTRANGAQFKSHFSLKR
ncbi:T9SS type B sorting domain-containing protein [Flavobacterium adhaerens]|uniref:DUF7948 domain-containing protein n=1 Tax=Flavobacterium adhaerens TaxID=3149043 RepID=UPI0032B3F046